MSDETKTENTEYELPQWARDQITKANNEAAKYRTEKNEAVEAAKARVAEEFNGKFAELEAQLNEAKQGESSARLEVLKLKAAINAGIASDKAVQFADLLKGENEEELVSHAEQLKGLFTTAEKPEPTKDRATDPSQGQGVSPATPLNGDKLLNDLLRVINK